jgi:hypothetical protein
VLDPNLHNFKFSNLRPEINYIYKKNNNNKIKSKNKIKQNNNTSETRITFLLAEIKGQRGEGSVEKHPPPSPHKEPAH